MRFQRFDDRYIVRLEDEEPVIEALLTLLEDEGVEFANVSAAGAVKWVQLEYWNPESRQYESRELPEQLEVVSFQGNASLRDGRPFLHIHGVFARRDYAVVGGHIKEARVHPTMEVWLRTESIAVRRTTDKVTGLDLLDLPERLSTPEQGAGGEAGAR